jgi:hypothetical protein
MMIQATTTSKRKLITRIKRGEKLMNEEAIRAYELDLGTIYRTTNGELALNPYKRQHGGNSAFGKGPRYWEDL